MQWLHELPDKEQSKVLNLAIKERPRVVQEYRKVEEQRSKQRQQNMLLENERREALKRKKQKERDELSQNHLITTPEELRQVLLSIDAENMSAQRKKAEKLSVLRTQIKIRKKVLGEHISIALTHSRKQRPLNTIVKELLDHINEHLVDYPEYIRDTCALVGKHIRHKFEEDSSQVTWYNGTIVGYDTVSKTHEIEYEGEDEPCHFDIGDLEVIT